MKIALITDTHYGVRNDNQLFINENQKFFINVFFPYIDKHQINTVIHLGDLVDRRKYINYNTANRLKNDFLFPLSERKHIMSHFILGNHDTYFKNSNSINAYRELFKNNYPNFKIYDKYPEEVVFEDLSILFIPWICDENKKESFDRIKNSMSRIAIGHLEISGFEMHKGSIVSHGVDRNVFDRFDIVYSGHYHHKSTDGHVFYLGSTGEYTWSDYNDDKGFHIFDTETKDVEFIQNPSKVFHKIIYNDADKDFLETKIDNSKYYDRYVKVIVKEKNNLYWYDKFIENLEAANPYDTQVVEDNLNLNIDDTDEISEVESTLDICYSYIDKVDPKNKHKEKVKNMISDIYHEALATK